MVARHFDIIDVGHKGFVTLEDIRQFSRARRAARQDRMPGADANSQEDQ